MVQLQAIYGLCLTFTRLESSYERREFMDKLLQLLKVEYLSVYQICSLSVVEMVKGGTTRASTSRLLKFRRLVSMIDPFGDQSVRR